MTLRNRFLALGAILLDPPGWVPAWATCGLLLVLGNGLIAGALLADSPVSLERMDFAAGIFNTMSETYRTTLGIWLGYKGLRALPDLLSALKGLRRPDELPPPQTEAKA